MISPPTLSSEAGSQGPPPSPNGDAGHNYAGLKSNSPCGKRIELQVHSFWYDASNFRVDKEKKSNLSKNQVMNFSP